MNDRWKFILQTLAYFIIFMILLYCYSYLGRGQGNFIYNEF
ncbi:teichoic acid D-Ala incorporation-associated protein DltX [Streptococcus sp. HF-1907]|nr:teichoic acid D-Ala incorporation-associated protein DltX [Streptococcus sp. HF-1907]MBF7094214.1 teichoic acid D-Ala incorporation-associated protein DltX [Streptococcus sp. HF-1907]